MYFSLTHNVSSLFSAQTRPTGSSKAGAAMLAMVPATAGQTFETINTVTEVLGTSSQIDYKINQAPATSGGLYIDVLGYRVPNGGE
jgi:hypothetical protein